jgi:hypothetical protein
MNKREDDYLSTFNEFMKTVMKDLKEKVEQIQKVEKLKRKKNDIKTVIMERDFFRQEAIRLNSLCKELSEKVEETNHKLKFKDNDLIILERKCKDSENANKQLIVEHQRILQKNKDMEYYLKFSAEKDKEPIVQPFNPPPKDENDYENFNKDKLVLIIEKLKHELKKERMRNHKILAELNKVLVDQNKLEKIFIDCFEESRKEIYNRKLRDALSAKAMSKNTNLHIPQLNEVKFENFMSGDKKKLVENFIQKDEIMNIIKDHVFKKIEYGSSIYDKKDSEMLNTRSSFMKTDKMFSTTNFRKKAPSSGLTYTMQISRTKTANH